MTEIERIETRIPVGMQLEINQQQRDLLVARAKRERGEYIAGAISKLARSIRKIFAHAGKLPAAGSSAPLRRQHQ